LLEAAQDEAPATTLYVTLQIVCEFYAIVTNTRRVLKPRSSADAWAAISGMLGFLRVLPVPVTAMDEVMALLCRRPVTGGDIFDLQIVATIKLNGISRIYTFNTDDFKPFQEIEALTP
jgi:predicted nucleic acid-binding protein